MMCISAVVLLVLVGPGAAVNTQVSPVQKVLQLIEDFAAKVAAEKAAQEKTFDEFAKYCDDEATEKDYATKNSKKQIEQLAATITDSEATIDTETTRVGDLSTSISSVEGELSNTISIRGKEHEEFVSAEKELLGTVESLAGAQTTLKKNLGLIQGAVSDQDKDAVNAVVASLAQIVEANFVTTLQKQKITAFFQAKEDAADEITLGNNLRGGGSDAILETLEEMEDKASGTLTETRKEETEGAHAYSMLKQGLENEIGGLKKEMGQSTMKKQTTAEILAQAEKDITVEKKGLAEDEKYLRDLKHDCQDRATQFEAESKDAEAELTALGKAKAILTKKFASLVQVSTSSRVQMRDEDDSRSKALRMIQQLGKQFHSTALISLAYRAAADPFAKVRGMIEEMIEKLLQEAAEEASQKAFCDEEIGKSKTSKVDKEGKLGKINARLDKAESTVAQMSEEVRKLSKEVADNDAAMSTATGQRTEEKSVFAVVEKDLVESEEACAAAISVLREYYEGASLIQVSSEAGEQGDGSGIIGLLEVAESDFANGLAEARSVESGSQSEYEKMMQDAKMLKVTKEMEIKGKQSELKSLKVTISDNTEDKEGLTDELDAVLAYLDKLKPQCETKVPSYAEIKAKREQEIEGLKEALGVLEG